MKKKKKSRAGLSAVRSRFHVRFRPTQNGNHEVVKLIEYNFLILVGVERLVLHMFA